MNEPASEERRPHDQARQVRGWVATRAVVDDVGVGHARWVPVPIHVTDAMLESAPRLALVATYRNGRGCSPLVSSLSKTRRRQPRSPLCYGGTVRQHAAEPLRSPSVLLSPVESRQGSSRGAEGGGAAPARAAGTTAHRASTAAAARAPGCRRGSRPSSPARSPAVAADWTSEDHSTDERESGVQRRAREAVMEAAPGQRVPPTIPPPLRSLDPHVDQTVAP